MNDAFAACVAGYGSHSPEVLHFGPVLNVQHASRWENIVDAADLSQTSLMVQVKNKTQNWAIL